MWRVRLTLSLLVSISLLAVAPASVSASCQPTGRSNDGIHRWTGFRDLSGTRTIGVYSNIYNYSPWVGTNNTFAYVMLRDVGGTQWAQVGWNQAVGHRWSLIEWTHDGTWSRHAANPQPTNTFSYYSMLYGATPGYFSFEIAGSIVENQPAQWTPNASEIMGEVQTGSNQMPGGSSVTERFNDSHKNLDTGGWLSYGGTAFNSNTNWYGNVKSSSLNDYAWDRACSS